MSSAPTPTTEQKLEMLMSDAEMLDQFWHWRLNVWEQQQPQTEPMPVLEAARMFVEKAESGLAIGKCTFRNYSDEVLRFAKWVQETY